jgi:kinesin family protein 2/24
MNSRICVAVRKKPVHNDDKDIVQCTSPNSILINEPKVKYDLTKYTDKHTFVFDVVLDEKCSNREVYQRCTAPLVDTVFSRGNATCFAYGQTGSGKTHTMLGKQGEPGLYACAAHEVFQRANAGGMVVYAAFYEIYGRKLFDLLNDKAALVCREDAHAQINICGLTEHPVKTVEELLRVIASGSAGRAAGQTSANAESSRSHAVLQLEVREHPTQRSVGRMSFIDLAGNERGSDTFNCDRKTRMEGAEINKSLLALKECIRSLGQGKSHVPFRGSILTEVLRDSFLGNSRTTMIATVSATSANCEHSLNTLRYTKRVKDLGQPEVPVVRERVLEVKEAPKRGAANMKEPKGGYDAEAFAAMAARIGADAAALEKGAVGGAAPARQNNNIAKPAAAGAKPAPQAQPQAGGRKSGKPQWIDDFASGNDQGDSDVEKPGPADPVDDDAPQVEKIIQNHIHELDEVDNADDDDDDDEDPLPAVAPSARAPRNPMLASAKKAKAVHAHIVDAIREQQEHIIVRHRAHVDAKNRLTKEEVVAIQKLDQSDNIDEYVASVDALLAKQEKEIRQMREALKKVRGYLREEEVLSMSLTPQAANAAANAARRQLGV